MRAFAAPVCWRQRRDLLQLVQAPHTRGKRTGNMADYKDTVWYAHNSATQSAMVSDDTRGTLTPQCKLSSPAASRQSSPLPAPCASCTGSAKRATGPAKVAKRGTLGARKLSRLSPAREALSPCGSAGRRGQAPKQQQQNQTQKQKKPLGDRTNVSLQHLPPATPPVPAASTKHHMPTLPSGMPLKETQQEPGTVGKPALGDATLALQLQQLQARNALLEKQLLASQARVHDLEARLTLTAQGAVLASVAALESQSQPMLLLGLVREDYACICPWGEPSSPRRSEPPHGKYAEKGRTQLETPPTLVLC